MAHAALPAIESGLAGAEAALRAGDLESMHSHLVRTLDALAQVTRDGLVPRQQRAPAPWDAAVAQRLVWEVLARLKAAECRVFPWAGTLLGLVRDGRLLPDDKDADLACWLEDFSLAARVLQSLGLQRATDVPPFANMATFVEPRSRLSLDLFGQWRDPVQQRVAGGVWLPGRPPSHQRLLHLPWFTLAQRAGPAGPVWWPDPAQDLLAALYGPGWRQPQPEWDALVSCAALQEVNLSWWCWACRSLARCWLTGDLARTRRLCDQVAARGGWTAPLAGWRDALDAGLQRAQQQP